MNEPVRYGTQIRLCHKNTNTLLKSVAVVYSHPKTSGQQIIGADAVDDQNSVWLVKGPHESGAANYPAGTEIKHGDKIRLEHIATGRNLHSHADRRSPLTSQQEVTAYGAAGIGDGNDDWTVDLGAPGTWLRGTPIRLLWSSTTRALHSHAGYNHPTYTAGLQEVTALAKGDSNDLWMCKDDAEGVVERPMVLGPSRMDWLTILNIVGSIASITGWTLVTFKEALQKQGYIDITALTLALGFTMGSLLMFSGLLLKLYRSFTFDPKPTPSRVGFWIFSGTAFLLFVLVAWAICQFLAKYPLRAFVEWVFSN